MNLLKRKINPTVEIPEAFKPLPELQPIIPSMQVFSVYIPTRDGTRLAADVYLPDPLPTGTRLPTILEQTRYWRSSRLRQPFSWFFPREGESFGYYRNQCQFFTSQGYACMVVDVRGTGASYGIWRYPWEAVTVLDSFDVVEWITHQPWSDGQVAGLGTSFPGTTAELLLATGHPAVKAVIPQFNHPDPFLDVGFPGGLLNERFVRAWGQMDINLDLNLPPEPFGSLYGTLVRGVKPVGGRQGLEDLRKAIEMHKDNGKLHGLPGGIIFRDQVHPLAGYSPNDSASVIYADTIQKSTVPVLGVASWMDAGTGQAALRRYQTYAGPQRAIIGAWNHAGVRNASPYLPTDAPPLLPRGMLRSEIVQFLNAWMKPGTGAAPGNSLIYYTIGAETWRADSHWPPQGLQRQPWYLTEGRRLVPHPPEAAGEDVFAVDFRASSGQYNRWWELGVAAGRSIEFNNRADQMDFVLAYETAPLDRDVEITGTPVLTLFVDSSEPDCAFYAYLEDVFPDGQIFCIGEGELRAVHRRKLDPPSVFFAEIPYHSFLTQDALPLQPGIIGEVSFALLPISVVVRAGHRLRLALAGHDDNNFERVPAEGQPVWKIQHSREHPSQLSLPIKWL